jgi:hypothetical protein
MRIEWSGGLRASLAWGVLALAAGCGGSSNNTSGSGGPPADAGTPDAGTADAGTLDAGTPDAGTADAGGLAGSLPATIGGATVNIQSFAGAQIAAPADDAWTQALARIGASAADLTLAVAVPPPKPASDLQLGAFRIARTDWTSRVNALVAAANAAGTVTFTTVQLGGKTVQRGQTTATPAGPKGYYYVAGDTLFFFSATNEAEVAEALGKIKTPPASSAPLRGAVPIPTDLPPPTGILLFSRLVVPVNPVCVGAPPNPGSSFMYMLTDGNTIPIVSGGALVQATYGMAFPPATVGPLVQFEYQARSWAGGNASLITLDAFSSVYGDHGRFSIIPPDLNVLQCLNSSQWMDGDRVVAIASKGRSFTATQTGGSLNCGSLGVVFTGTFSGSQLSGSDLVVCNPKACVSAGFLSETGTTTYQGTMADDGLSIAMNWDAPDYKLTYDKGTLISCTPLPTVPQAFSLTRPFADPWTP